MSDGDSFILGQDNSAESQTNLRRTGDENGVYGLNVEFLDGNAVGGRSALGIGIEGVSFGGVGVKGACTQFEGVWGTSTNGPGVGGGSTNGPGVRGTSFQGFGVEGFCYGTQVGVQGTCHKHIGVRGDSDSHVGMRGRSTTGIGVRGSSAQQSDDFSGGVGVHGIGTNAATGVAGVTDGGIGVLGINSGHTGVAGLFAGNVAIAGALIATTKLFKIDHPLDPEKRYLAHASVESPDMKTVYDGVVVLDAKGGAVVRLPAWFEALNKDYRYQLTSMGAPCPNLHIAKEVAGNQFAIGGVTSGLKVSWQVTGIRQDPWARAHPLVVEQDKASDDLGHDRYVRVDKQIDQFRRWIDEDRAETEAIMAAQRQRMDAQRARMEKETFPKAP